MKFLFSIRILAVYHLIKKSYGETIIFQSGIQKTSVKKYLLCVSKQRLNLLDILLIIAGKLMRVIVTLISKVRIAIDSSKKKEKNINNNSYLSWISNHIKIKEVNNFWIYINHSIIIGLWLLLSVSHFNMILG